MSKQFSNYWTENATFYLEYILFIYKKYLIIEMDHFKINMVTDI